MRRAALGIVVLLAGVVPASAQSTYVAGAIGADLLRYGGTESEFEPELENNGEALSLAVRVGTPLGDRWGVEAEFARSGVIANASEAAVPLPIPQDFVSLGLPYRWSSSSVVPFLYRTETRQRTTTFAASAWLRQDLTSRMALAYMAGLGFFRSEHDWIVSVEAPPGVLAVITVPAMSTTSTTYGVKPLVGLEGRLRVTDRVELVPGVRLQGLDGGWLVRPSVAAAWLF